LIPNIHGYCSAVETQLKSETDGDDTFGKLHAKAVPAEREKQLKLI
jgi:hypothetical protein